MERTELFVTAFLHPVRTPVEGNPIRDVMVSLVDPDQVRAPLEGNSIMDLMVSSLDPDKVNLWCYANATMAECMSSLGSRALIRHGQTCKRFGSVCSEGLPVTYISSRAHLRCGNIAIKQMIFLRS
jgi:hypothetical protein